MREWLAIAGSTTSAVGRTSFMAKCPWCSAVILIYAWSLAGCGKRCPCGAMFLSGRRSVKPARRRK